jgi:hypothetical protein
LATTHHATYPSALVERVRGDFALVVFDNAARSTTATRSA